MEPINKTALYDVKAWRESMGYSVADAIKFLEVKETDFRKWENGEKPIPRYIALACAALAMGIKA